jgi:hypothetical protein
MSLTRVLVAALLLTPATFAAELATLEGKKLTGEIVSITGNELTFKPANGPEEKFLVTTLASVTTGPAPKAIGTGTKHTTVELTDGSLFRCSEIVLKGQMLEMKLLGTPPRTVSVLMRDPKEGRGAVYAVNREAGDVKLEQDFRSLLRNRSRKDQFVFKRKVKNDQGVEVDALDASAGTFGEASADGSTIHFVLDADGKDSDLRMTQVVGMIFNQRPPETIPPAMCKVIDTDGNEMIAATAARTDKGYSITCVSGAKIDLDGKLVSKFDFAAGAVKYLSDLEPVGLDESGTDPEHYQKDKNLDKRPIRLVTDPAAGKSEVFPKGLTFKAKTIISYELKGQYKSFRAIAGVDADPENAAPSVVKITIDDGMQVLWKGNIKKGDKPVDLNLSVQNVDRLKITVESDGTVTDLGNQVSFGNARVLK